MTYRHDNHCGPRARRDHHGRHRRRRGFVRRVIHTLGQRFNIKPRWVLAGFIVGFIIQPMVALGLFLLAWFWIDHPGKLEGWWAQTKALFGAGMAHATATVGGGQDQPASSFKDSDIEVDIFMDDLKRQFEDLERRTNDMETHVTSEEYELRREFKKMDDRA